jgi:hypothetical protein
LTLRRPEWRRRESNPLLLGANEALRHQSFIPRGVLRMHGHTSLGGDGAAAGPVGGEVSSPHLRFDQRVSRCQRGRDSVPAVAYEERIAVTNEPNGRRLAAAFEPRSVELDGRRADTSRSTTADPNVCELDPVSEWRVMRSSFRGRMRCGRVESNHHSTRRRGYSPLSSPMLGVRKEG